MTSNKEIFEDSSISIFPSGDNMKGIFWLMKKLVGTFESRYKLIADIKQGTRDSIFDFYGTTNVTWARTNDNSPNITFSFDNSLILTDYSIYNGADQSAHSYPTSWNIIGKDENGNEFRIDTRKKIKYCESNFCGISILKTFHTKNHRAAKEITFMQTEGSSGLDFVFLRSMELFGVFCDKGKKCSFPYKRGTCNISRRKSPYQISILILLIYS